MKTKLLVLTALCLLLQLSAIAQVTPSPDPGRGLYVSNFFHYRSDASFSSQILFQ